MKKLLLILFGIVVLTGCNTDSSLSFSEVSQESINKDIQSFFQDVKEENGVHLYFDNQNSSMFVYLNASNVIQDEKAVYFTGFDVKRENDTINILYKSDKTSEYSNSSLEHELFYKVNFDKDYEEVKLFNDSNETSFGTISGKQLISS